MVQPTGSPIDCRQAATPTSSSSPRARPWELPVAAADREGGQRRGPSEQEALPGADAQRRHLGDLLGVLETLGDDERVGLGREAHHRADDGIRGRARRAALDEAEVDLEDVEAQLGQQAQAGVARRPGRRRRSACRPPEGVELHPRRVEVAQRLVLGELDDQVLGREAVARQDLSSAGGAELRRLDGPGDDVDAQELLASRQAGAPATIVSMQARSSVDEVAAAGGRREQAAGIGERGRRVGRMSPS